jgi:type IV secretory pathway TrbF-like protein
VPAKSPSNRAPALSAHLSAPPGVFDEAENKFAEIYGSAKVGHQRMFVVALGAILFGGIAVVALAMNIGSNVAVPWYVPVNAENGVVTKPVRVDSIRPAEAVIKAEIAKWAKKVFTIDATLSPQLFREANVMTKGLGTAQFTDFRVKENVVDRMAKDASLQRSAEVRSVDASQPGVAFVFVTTQEAKGTNPNAATASYRVTVKYELSLPTTEQDILNNPLGLFITSMNVTEEGAHR